MEEEDIKTADICSTLFWRLLDKGLKPDQINQLVKDVFKLVEKGGLFTIAFVNYELELIGWGPNVIDENIFEMILALLETELDFTITLQNIH